jgi:four helix bundle protein
MQDFTQLRVWHQAQELAAQVHQATVRTSSYRYPGLASQLWRAAAAIPANLAEGCASASRPRFAHFLQVAIASASEVQSHLVLAKRLRAIPPTIHAPLAGEVISVRRQRIALRQAVLARHSARTTNRRPPT